MASEHHKGLDATSLRLSYQRKASEYLFRMSSRMTLDEQTAPKSQSGDSTYFLRTIGQSMISRLCSQSISANRLVQNTGNNATRAKYMKTVTNSQESMFNYFRNSIGGSDDDQHTDVVSYRQISDHIDHLIRLNDSYVEPILCNAINFVCPCCFIPFLLCPMTMRANTMIRLHKLKRGKARHRRSLRFRQKQAISDQKMLKHQGGGKKFAAVQPHFQKAVADRELASHGSLIAGVATEKMEWIKQHMIRRVRDGQGAQKISYRCGYCYHRSCYKGASALKRESRRIDRREVNKGTTHSTSSLDIHSTSLVAAEESKKLNASINATTPSSNIKTIPLVSNPSKKRKVPNTKPSKDALKKGKSTLMDFLSSLND